MTLDAFDTFDAAAAKCSLERDRDCLLGVIESGMGSIDKFNQLVRSVFTRAGQVELERQSADDNTEFSPHEFSRLSKQYVSKPKAGLVSFLTTKVAPTSMPSNRSKSNAGLLGVNA